MAFTPAPIVPDRADRLNFPTRMYNMFVWIVATISELSTLGNAYNFATSATSTTSNSLTTGAKTFTVPSGLGFQKSMSLRIGNTASPLNYANATVTDYVGTTLSVNFDGITGAGTAITTWTISLAATSVGASLFTNIFTGLQRWFAGANITAAATVDLAAATGNTVVITGITTTSAFTMTAGQWMFLVAPAGWKITHNTTTANIQGGVDYTCEAGDRLLITKDNNNIIQIQPFRQNGIANADREKLASITATQAVGALTLGTNPGPFDFRSTTLTNGVAVSRTLSVASSLVVPSGATLGIPTGTSGRLVKGLLDNAGTLEEFVVNLSGGVNLDETGLITTVAMSVGATSANVAYSTVARVGVAYRVTGFVDVVNTTGAYSNPTLLQGAGGEALKTINKIIITPTIASTSGTSIDFTGIPAWVKRITVMLTNVSTNGITSLMVQLGDSGGIEVTGYLGAESTAVGATAAQNSTGFNIKTGTVAASLFHGVVTLVLIEASTNTWAQSGNIATSNTTQVGLSGGSKSLSAALDRIRITTSNGTDLFDAGSIALLLE